MRQDSYKKLMFKKWLIPRLVGAGIILITVLIIVILTTMQQSEQLYLEGVAKSMPLVTNDKMKMLGDLYVDLNRDFEKDIKDMELNFANRTNKRGDKIHYGVNGKENIDELYNEDYVNGIHITYVKGNANRADGDSNFNDMISFLTTSLYSNMDEYTDEELKEIFTKLFKLTHTFEGTSTELYPCKHGCSWCKYYCGDIACQGTVGGETVGFYRSDLYMGKSGEYGLMYNPFVPELRTTYQILKDYAGNETKHKTVFTGTGAESGGIVYSLDDEIYEMTSPIGYCEVCSQGKRVFTHTTKTFGGCQQELTCHHGELYGIEEGMITIIPEVYKIGDEGGHSPCTNCEIVPGCRHVCGENEEECPHDSHKPPFDADGCWACNGHPHYACPGHIIVTCFGHTDLNLDIKIMYYEEMIEELKGVIS